ncbi:conserved hypothetical protein [Deferribacter desulfuricans SSM1]|uniref:DUF493 domain-containing protein n=1 Tax=Deferribacter desulfuricans (strain DSM 14783 / JCM 11476 / NBRC 101012 / SSM1) TaxID=639282 RepID=D3PCF3_DEFDS|nr:DUF493 domain-containing protein [Deferribacter desulfuricans]BAI80276.1 conserved hypothetical protein [Deferribacter desulfuricans SSM1]
MNINIDEVIEFPTLYTFKIIGINTEIFKNKVILLFQNKKNKNLKFNLSKSNKYLSVTVEVEVINKDELFEIYKKIKNIQGVTYFL